MAEAPAKVERGQRRVETGLVTSDAASLDQAAAGQLTAVRRPWVLGTVSWTPALIRRAVISLSRQVGKALLKLSDDDFRERIRRPRSKAQKSLGQGERGGVGPVEQIA